MRLLTQGPRPQEPVCARADCPYPLSFLLGRDQLHSHGGLDPDELVAVAGDVRRAAAGVDVALAVVPPLGKVALGHEDADGADGAKETQLCDLVTDAVHDLSLEELKDKRLVPHRHHDEASAFLQLALIRLPAIDYSYDDAGILLHGAFYLLPEMLMA